MKDLTNQLKNILEGKNNILLISHKRTDGDGLSSMIILKKYLEKKKKNVTAYSMEDIPEVYNFLPYIRQIDSMFHSSSDLVINVKCEGVEVDKLKYVVDGDNLNIIVTPKSGEFKQECVSTKKTVGNYDLIFVLDSGDLEHIGDFYEQNTALFYSTPIINIDHHATNTGFGQLNFVDIKAASTTQIVYNIIKELEKENKEFFDKNIATLFLTGLIVDTGSFQHTNTSPASLEFAADLIEMGADQQKIIQNIYKTKKLSTLKLWGRVLSKIEEDPIHKIVWSTITKDDLKETGASTEDADGLIDELMTNAPGAEIVVLIKDSFEGIMSASIRSTSISIDTLPIAQHFGGGGHKQASGFKQKGHNFNLFIADVIGFIEKQQEERLELTEEKIEELRMKYYQNEISFKNNKKIDIKEISQRSFTEERDIISEIAIKDKTWIDTRKKEEIKNYDKEIKNEVKEVEMIENYKENIEVQKQSQKEENTIEKHNKSRLSRNDITEEKIEEKFQIKRFENNKKDQSNEQKRFQQKTSTKQNEFQKKNTPQSESKKIESTTKNEKLKVKDQKQTPFKPQQQIITPKRQESNQHIQSNKQTDPSAQKTFQQELKQQNISQDIKTDPSAQKTVQQELKQQNISQDIKTDPSAQKTVQQELKQQNISQDIKTDPSAQKTVQQELKQQDMSKQETNQQIQQQITKDQAQYYAEYYANYLHQMDPNSPNYYDTYQYWQYYANLAQTL